MNRDHQSLYFTSETHNSLMLPTYTCSADVQRRYKTFYHVQLSMSGACQLDLMCPCAAAGSHVLIFFFFKVSLIHLANLEEAAYSITFDILMFPLKSHSLKMKRERETCLTCWTLLHQNWVRYMRFHQKKHKNVVLVQVQL